MRRILVVDDQSENRDYLATLLRARGYEVALARHGAEALLLAGAEPPDLVIADLLMPTMDGYTLLRIWKAEARLRDIPFIVYTATYTDPDDEALALQCGADAFLIKPAEPEAFLQRIDEVRERFARGEAPRPRRPLGAESHRMEAYNVTLVRKLEEKSTALEQERQRLIRAQCIARIGSWELDLPTGRMQASAEFFRLYQRPADTPLRYADVLEAIHPEDRETTRATLEQAFRSPGEGLLEHRVRCADGTVREIELRWQLAVAAGGRGVEVRGTAQDVSERKALERELSQAQRLDAIGQLTGGVAHDFNNLLTVVVNCMELLRERAAALDGALPLIDAAQKAAEHGADLTRRLLAFARRRPLAPQPVDLSRLLEELRPLLARLLGPGIALDIAVDPGTPALFVDPAQLESTISNLCINSRDALQGSGRILLRAAPAPSGARPPEVLIAVTDEGSGMAPEVVSRMFEPFFTTKEPGRGTGLGLSLVHRFMQQSGGRVEVDSAPGRGTTLRLYFPASPRPLPVAPPAVPGTAAPAGGECILVVEDEPMVREHLGLQLESLGYRVHAVAEAEQALSLLATAQPPVDLLLTDLMLPGTINGLALAARAQQRQPGLAVLLTSGYPEGALPQGESLPGGWPLLGKPYRRAELAAKVREALERAGPASIPAA